MTITPVVVPSVSFIVNPNDTVCAGTSVTFTATPVNGGSSPVYQWKRNGINVGTNTNAYSDVSPVSGNIYSCIMTTNAVCPTTTTASFSDTIVVDPIVTPAVTIAANPGNSICAGASVTFTATPTNGGSAPSYQWKVNGTNVGTNSNTYITTTLANGDLVSCVMTSSASCLSVTTATSTSITMTVTPTVTPSVSISVNPGNTICVGTNATFTATPTNGGSSPTYQWKVNGVNSGTGSTFSSTGLSNGDVVSCVMTSNATCPSPATATSNNITMTVYAYLTPSVSISASPGNTICAGTPVTFTAVPTNGGSSPSYQWKVNGVNVGTNSSTYASSTLANSDVVTCALTTSFQCITTANATSNAITMMVSPVVTPGVSISANPGNTICAGTSVVFTAVPTNGGSSPSYQWKLNGVNVGSNSTTYTSSTLVNSDVITCVMTSNASCTSTPTATSNTIAMTVNPVLSASVSISANPGNTICAGASVTFTATPVNAGSSPSYQWKRNGINVGTNSATYISTTLANGDVITCEMTSSVTCANPLVSVSSGITMTVNALVTPSLTIAANPGSTLCAGNSATFTATLTNGGSTPSYQWKVNGINVGTNSATYSSGSFGTGDVVTCVLTSNATCASPVTATSNTITMTVNPTLIPAVTVNVTPSTTVGPWVPVNFSANVTNGGSAPTYQWRKNGIIIAGASNSTYSAVTSSELANNDVICVFVKSNATCVLPDTASSCAPAIKISLGVPVVKAQDNIRLYPNPNTGNFIVKSSVIPHVELCIEIKDPLGQVIYKSITMPSTGELYHKFNLHDVSRGIYMLHLKQGEDHTYVKFVVD